MRTHSVALAASRLSVARSSCCTILKRMHSIAREHILSYENTFYRPGGIAFISGALKLLCHSLFFFHDFDFAECPVCVCVCVCVHA